MKRYSMALYDAFTEVPFGGSQAAVITDAASIDASIRQRVAREIGMPASAFVDAYGDDWVQVQFLSTVMELPMCGHGTLCLLTHLLETGRVQAGRDIELRLPRSRANVSVSEVNGGRFLVMLDIVAPSFEQAPAQSNDLLTCLGVGADALSSGLPLEIARGDFVHLIVPLAGLDAMRALKPDFRAMIGYCHAHGLETIAVFCLETEDPARQLHVRDFCPAVGVSESAAAGTTNAALSSYLLRHAVIAATAETVVLAEQGLELGRPSSIQSRITTEGGHISRLQVGGIATRVFEGEIYL